MKPPRISDHVFLCNHQPWLDNPIKFLHHGILPCDSHLFDLKTGIDGSEVSRAVIIRDALDVQEVIFDSGVPEPSTCIGETRRQT